MPNDLANCFVYLSSLTKRKEVCMSDYSSSCHSQLNYNAVENTGLHTSVCAF